MSDVAERYRKLSPWKVVWWEVRFSAPRQLFPIRIHRLWEGSDHLLVVSAALGVERYRRFYFRQIEALIVRKTMGRFVANTIFAVIAALAGPGALIYFVA